MAAQPPDLHAAELFRHVRADKAAVYRAVLDVFANAKRQYRLQLRPDEVLQSRARAAIRNCRRRRPPSTKGAVAAATALPISARWPAALPPVPMTMTRTAWRVLPSR